MFPCTLVRLRSRRQRDLYYEKQAALARTGVPELDRSSDGSIMYISRSNYSTHLTCIYNNHSPSPSSPAVASSRLLHLLPTYSTSAILQHHAMHGYFRKASLPTVITHTRYHQSFINTLPCTFLTPKAISWRHCQHGSMAHGHRIRGTKHATIILVFQSRLRTVCKPIVPPRATLPSLALGPDGER